MDTNNQYSVLLGDCLESLKLLADGSVDCCVTSPPYYGLRDYGVVGQIGLEESPEAYVARLVEVFREVRRVLSDTGTLWLNIGDSYYNHRPGKGQIIPKQTVSSTNQDLPTVCARRGNKLKGLKEKDLIGIPWMLAFALSADGWYLRQDIIWNKTNPMPESVRDRCTKSHEYIFLLTKSPKYYYDHKSIKEDLAEGSDVAYRNKLRKGKKYDAKAPYTNNFPASFDEEKRNKRSVWTLATKPYKGAHFATFPPALIEPCIIAGCPLGGVVLDPFGGSGTTAGVAIANGRRALLCELNPDYVELIKNRVISIVGDSPPSLF